MPNRGNEMLDQLRRADTESKGMLVMTLFLSCAFVFGCTVALAALACRFGGPGAGMALVVAPAWLLSRRSKTVLSKTLPLVAVCASIAIAGCGG